jgi:hypothetical protein
MARPNLTIVFDRKRNMMSFFMSDRDGHDQIHRDMAWAGYVVSQDEFERYCARFFSEWKTVYLQ